MSYLADIEVEDPIEIPGTGGETVRFRSGATYADEVELGVRIEEQVPAQVVIPGEPLVPNARRLEVFAAERTCLMIAEWTLRDKQGEILGIKPEVISRGLKRPVADWLIEEARLRYDGRAEEAEGPFEKPSRQLSRDTQ